MPTNGGVPQANGTGDEVPVEDNQADAAVGQRDPFRRDPTERPRFLQGIPAVLVEEQTVRHTVEDHQNRGPHQRQDQGQGHSAGSGEGGGLQKF